MIPLPKGRRIRMILVVSFAIILLEIVLLLQAGGRLSREKRTQRALVRRLTELRLHDPYPSAANCDLLARIKNELERLARQSALQWPVEVAGQAELDAADFSARAQAAVEQFKLHAAEAGVIVPPSLEAGFARYASGGVVPEQRYVPRLCRQLDAVQRISSVLINSGVASIDLLRREEFDAVENVPEEIPRRRSRRDLSPDEPDLKRSVPLVDQSAFLRKERIDVAFSAREDVVWDVLRKLASDDGGMVVSEFSHNTRTQILMYDPESVRTGTGSEDETLKYLAEGILVGEGALSRAERIVTGDELVDVRLVVDVYRPLPDAEGDNG